MHLFVAKLLSIAVMTYIYVYDPRNLHPMIRLICCAHSEWSQHATAARAHDARRATSLSFDVSFLERPCEYPYKLILPETRPPKLHDNCYSILLHNCCRKPRKCVRGERQLATPLTLNGLLSREPERIFRGGSSPQILGALPPSAPSWPSPFSPFSETGKIRTSYRPTFEIYH